MSCELSSAGSAFSAVVSAFVGSIINGVTSGWLVAFMTGWISWMAIFRVLLSGLYMFSRSVSNSWGPGKRKQAYDSVQGVDDAAGGIGLSEANSSSNLNGSYNSNYNNPNNPPNPGDGTGVGLTSFQAMMLSPRQARRQWMSHRDTFRAMWPPPGVIRGVEEPTFRKTPAATNHPVVRTWSDLNYDVTVLGWISWTYTAIFAPITQIIWIAANASVHDRGPAKLVKGLTTAVTALPLCIDCRVRYGERLGAVGQVVFNLVTSVSVLLQGGFCAFLLVTGILDLDGLPPVPFLFVYPVFSLIWMFASYSLVPMRDGGRKSAGQAHWAGYLVDLGMGAFAGVFLAAPALVVYVSGRGDGVSDLGEYLRCERDVFRKWAAVMP